MYVIKDDTKVVKKWFCGFKKIGEHDRYPQFTDDILSAKQFKIRANKTLDDVRRIARHSVFVEV